MTEIVLLIVVIVLVAYIGYLHIIDAKERKEFITALIAKDLRDKNEYEKGYPQKEYEEKPPELVSLDDIESENIFDRHIKKVIEEGGENEPEPEPEQ
jgi:hypothetical protein